MGVNFTVQGMSFDLCETKNSSCIQISRKLRVKFSTKLPTGRYFSFWEVFGLKVIVRTCQKLSVGRLGCKNSSCILCVWNTTKIYAVRPCGEYKHVFPKIFPIFRPQLAARLLHSCLIHTECPVKLCFFIKWSSHIHIYTNLSGFQSLQSYFSCILSTRMKTTYR